jgi:hypothetical protein
LLRLIATLLAAVSLVAAAALARPRGHLARAAPAADLSAAMQQATSQQGATQQAASQQATSQPSNPAPPAPQPSASPLPERWSAPADLSGCPAGAGARVVFPSDRPTHATGPGAIVWEDSPACPGGEGARIAAIGAGDRPGAALVPRTAAGRAVVPRGALVAGGAPHGQIVIAGADGLLIQGAAGGPFSPLLAPGGTAAPMALSTAYLGDVALASPPAAPSGKDDVDVHVERFFTHRFVRNVTVRSAGDGALQALTLAMDFRSEALVVWAQRGTIYARLVPNRGAARPIQQLAHVGAHVRIAALLSDDGHGIVAWAEQSGGETSVYIDRSELGVRFVKPELLERFSDPDGLSSPAGSPSLVRLSSESVMLAWAGSAEGHWVVRAAPVDLDGVLTLATIAAPGADALLAGMAPGPDDDALLLWTEPVPSANGVPDMARQALFAARGTEAGTSAIFDEPEPVAAPGAVSQPTVAIDPDDDTAIAVWQGEAGTIEYSVRGASADP